MNYHFFIYTEGIFNDYNIGGLKKQDIFFENNVSFQKRLYKTGSFCYNNCGYICIDLYKKEDYNGFHQRTVEHGSCKAVGKL